MKRFYIISLFFMTALANGRQDNYEVARTANAFNCMLDDEMHRMAVVLFYSSDACDNNKVVRIEKDCEHACSLGSGGACRNSRQSVISYRKQFKVDWRYNTACLQKVFRKGSCDHTEVLFILVDISRPGSRSLASQFDVTSDRPVYVMFSDGKPVGRKYVNMDQLAQSSLFTFVHQYVNRYAPREEYECVEVRDMFQPNSREYSTWDWGGPFWNRALGATDLPYFDAMLD